jgi:hypothetical protein
MASEILERARSTTSILGNTTNPSSVRGSDPHPDKDPFSFKSSSHTGQPIRAF